MTRVCLGDVARECKETCKEDKTGYPIVGLEHLHPGDLTLSEWDTETETTFTKMFRKGSILFGRRRAYLKKAAVAPFDGICSGDITVIKAIEERIVPELLPFIIQNDAFFEFAVGKSAGSLSPRVKWEHLKTYEFELPSLEKQRELAELLWAIDDTKKSYQKLLEVTDELVKSQFIEMFGDPTDSGLTRIPLGEYVENTKYGTSQPPQYDENGCFKFIRATNIKNGHITEEDMRYISKEEADKIGKCRLTSGELIIVRSGVNTGDTCVVTNEYNGQYAGYDIIVTLKTDKLNPVFLNELINAPEYMKTVVKPLTARSAQPHLNTQQVQGLPILVVDIDKQNEFADFSEQSDKSKFELKQTLSELEALSRKIVADYLG